MTSAANAEARPVGLTVADALAQAGFYSHSERVARCGQERPLYCGACGAIRLGCYRCDVAVCHSCARRRAARLVASWTATAARVPPAAGYRWALLTLTLRRTEEALRSQVARILRHWRAFRARLKRRCDPEGRKMGGFMAVEVAGAVHLHVVAYLPFIPQRWLSATWLAVTGDSSVVDIRAVRGRPRDAIREAVKYIAKAVGTEDAATAVEVWQAMRGRQVRRPWGVCWALRVEEKPSGVPCEKCGGRHWLTPEGLAWLERRAVLASGYG